MKRMGRACGSLAVVALLLAACSDDGATTLSEDDFVDELNAICDDASGAIGRLDVTDSDYFDDVLEVMQTGADDLDQLQAPDDLEDDFQDLVDNLDDTINETENLRDAFDDEDADAIAESSEELTNLAEDANELADSLGADDCVDVGGGTAGPVTTDSVPDETTAETPLPIDTGVATTAETTPETTADTTGETGAPPITNPPATTAPATTAPASTAPATSMPEMTIPPSTGDGLASDASTVWEPVAGYQWTPLDDLAGQGTPFGDPVIGPTLSAYWVGRLENPTTGDFAYMFIGESNSPWTDEQIEALFEYELVSGGTDVTTPGGLFVRVATMVLDGEADAGFLFTDDQSVLMLVPTGFDVLGLLDGFVAANSMGG